MRAAQTAVVALRPVLDAVAAAAGGDERVARRQLRLCKAAREKRNFGGRDTSATAVGAEWERELRDACGGEWPQVGFKNFRGWIFLMKIVGNFR